MVRKFFRNSKLSLEYSKCIPQFQDLGPIPEYENKFGKYVPKQACIGLVVVV
jgi:hypothetical protein